MKFVVRNVMNGCRLGHLSDVKKLPDLCMDTPNCTLYTRFGSAPHLTKDMLGHLEEVPPISLISSSNFIEHMDALSTCDDGVAKFVNMTNQLVYSCPNDPIKAIPTGHNDKNSSAVWARGGKVKVNPKEYMSLQEAMIPDFYEVMADCDLHENVTSSKRLQKASQRSLDWLDQCMKIHDESDKLRLSSILGVLTGGYSTEERCKLAKQLAVRPLDGYVLDGFHPGGEVSKDFSMAAVCDAVRPSLKELPTQKPRFIKGAWRPDQILEAVKLGIDIFDSSYCYQVTEQGAALIFSFNYADYTKDRNVPSTGYEINLKDKDYLDDFSPLLNGCKCYTCRTHTKSYITHLLSTNELLANVLLMIHNFHHYFGYFKAIRQSLEGEKLDVLDSLIQAQKKNDG